MVNREDKAYLAGVIDSDGSLSINRLYANGRKNPAFLAMIQLTWSQTPRTKKFILSLISVYGGSYCKSGKIYETNFKNCNPVFKYCATGTAANLILLDIYPFLRLKKRQARKLLSLIKLKKSFTGHRPLKISLKMQQLHTENKILNTKNGSKSCTL